MTKWSTQKKWKLVALFAFLAGYNAYTALRSSIILYFYRTGYACTEEQTVDRFDDPGDWSGSKYCGNKDNVIGAAQRLSAVLLPVQMVVEFCCTPFFAALADKWSYIYVVLIGYFFAVGGMILYTGAASSIPGNYDKYKDASHSGIDLQLIMPLSLSVLARVAVGLGNAMINAPSGGLIVSYAPVQHRVKYVAYFMLARFIPSIIGGVAAVAVANMYLESYTGFFIALSIMWVPLLALIGFVIWGCCYCRRAPTADDPITAETDVSMSQFAVDWSDKRRHGKLVGFCGILKSLCETLQAPCFFRVVLADSLIWAGAVGSLVILPSYMQTAHSWPQELFSTLFFCAGTPCFLIAGYVQFKCIYPRGGFASVIRIGYSSIVVAMAVLCLVPWVAWFVVVAICLICAGSTGWFGVIFMCVRCFRQGQQAQFQALYETFTLFAMLISIIVFSFVLYDEHTESQARQAVPFVVSLMISTIAFTIFWFLKYDTFVHDATPNIAASSAC